MQETGTAALDRPKGWRRDELERLIEAGTDNQLSILLEQARTLYGNQSGAGELVGVHQAMEAVPVTIPDVPDKGTVVEEFAVLLKEFVAQPGVEGGGGFLAIAGDGKEFAFLGGRPVGSKGGGEQFTETIGGRAFTAGG